MAEYESGHDPFGVGGSTDGHTKEDGHKGGGGLVSKPGFYHVQVDTVSLKLPEGGKNKHPEVEIIMTAVAAEDGNEDQIGKKYYHRIRMVVNEDPEKEKKRILGLATFLYELGVMSESEAFGNPDFRITRAHFERLEGCQAIVKLKHDKPREYEDQETGEKKMTKDSWTAWNNDFWNVHHEKVRDVPKDPDLMAFAVPRDAQAQTSNDLDGI